MRIKAIKVLTIVLSVVLSTSVLYSCLDDDSPGSSNFWAPMIQIKKDDGKATLFLTDPTPLWNYTGPAPSNPDYFNILISEDLNDFTFYERIEISTTSFLIDNLVNGKPYFFVVTSHKGENAPIHSDTVMTIPSPEWLVEDFLPSMEFSIKGLSTSFDLSYLSFNRTSEGGDQFYFKDNASGAINSLGINLYGLTWADNANKLVYVTSKTEGSIRYPFELKLFDPQSGLTTTLLEVPYYNYYVGAPTFTPDGSKVAFLSSENNSEKNIFDLWTIDVITHEKTRISNFEEMGFYTDSKYDWSNSGEEIYLDGRYNLSHTNDVYKFNIVTKTLTPLIESRWDEWSPSVSPDNTKIAFKSNRTGRDELWTYNLVTFAYSQVTGGPAYIFDSRYLNLQWLNNSEMLITMYEESKSIPVKIKVD